MKRISGWRHITSRLAFSLIACLLTSQVAAAQNRDIAEKCVSNITQQYTERRSRVFDGAEPGLYLMQITINGTSAKAQRAGAPEIEKIMAQCQMRLRKLIAHEIFTTCDQNGNGEDCFSRQRYIAEFSFFKPVAAHEAASNQQSAILDWIRYKIMSAASEETDLDLKVNVDPQSPDHVHVEIIGLSHTACLLAGLAFDGSDIHGYAFDGKNIVKIGLVSQTSESVALIGAIKSRHITPPQLCKFTVNMRTQIQD